MLASSSPQRRRLLEAVGLPVRVVPPQVDEALAAPVAPARAVVQVARRKAVAVAGRVGAGCWIVAADTALLSGGELFGKPPDRAAARRLLRRLAGATHRVLTGVALIPPATATALPEPAGDLGTAATAPARTKAAPAPPKAAGTPATGPACTEIAPAPPLPAGAAATALACTEVTPLPVRTAAPMATALACTEVTLAALSERELEWYLDTGEWRGAAGGYRIQGRAGLLVTALRGSYSNVVGLPLETIYRMLARHGYPFRSRHHTEGD